MVPNGGLGCLSPLGDTRVVVIAGPRQAGNTTLVSELCSRTGRRFLTLDDETTLLAATTDPTGLLSGRAEFAIDEIQRAPAFIEPFARGSDEVTGEMVAKRGRGGASFAQGDVRKRGVRIAEVGRPW